ncbi:transglycosylase domain-containing protein [Streptomyces sp. NBC_00878]|uniref:transglycosylase domain-containing protein n=1 Tax=Streptomyces sp. NBC_00878 TaxID=2975854 RepID=UPI00224CE1F6|nr:transglycosylase domain-containing protein [Streptomyces sp. NBC_00878]MCX4907300.1 penicillin-binding protein [Streptomyces sp. NBC_00878]
MSSPRHTSRSRLRTLRSHLRTLRSHLRTLRNRLRRTRPRRLRRALAALLVLFLTACAALVVAYRMTEIPDPHPETVSQSTVFVDAEGEYLGRRGPVDRQDIPLKQVPRHVQDAVIAAENRSFRTDSGVAPAAILRAALATVTGGERQGGSTITQQYVKNALLTPEQSLSRKAREALIAVKLDRTRSKDEILEGYFNTVYFGRGAAGVESAARNYFGVGAKDLTVSQGAALASIVNIPSYYERAGADAKVTRTLERRWVWVLDAMAASGAISERERTDARFPAFRFYPPGDTDGGRQYLIDAASAEAADRLGITEDQLARGGYKVHTTFDLGLQDATAELVRDRTPAATKGTRLHTAVVATVPGDGAIRVLYGGSDYAHQPFNDAVDGAVEAGTATEPFAFKGLWPGEPLTDVLKEAAPTPVRLNSAYAAVAAGGTYAAPYTVTKITRAGRTVHTTDPKTRASMDEKQATLITALLHASSASGSALEPVAGKVDAASLPATSHSAGAGSGPGARTVWQNVYSSRLALTVALFAERGGKPARVAGLTGAFPPAEHAALEAGELWQLAGSPGAGAPEAGGWKGAWAGAGAGDVSGDGGGGGSKAGDEARAGDKVSAEDKAAADKETGVNDNAGAEDRSKPGAGAGVEDKEGTDDGVGDDGVEDGAGVTRKVPSVGEKEDGVVP